MPVWATLIALTVRGEPVVGVASAPALGRRWWAARGEGAWTSDGPGAARRAGSRCPGWASWPTPTCPPPTCGPSPRAGPPRPATCGWSTPAGRPARSATSGSTAWSPRACSTSPWTRWRTRGTWPRWCRSSPRRAARSPTCPAPQRSPAATASPPTAPLHDAALAIVGTARRWTDRARLRGLHPRPCLRPRHDGGRPRRDARVRPPVRPAAVPRGRGGRQGVDLRCGWPRRAGSPPALWMRAYVDGVLARAAALGSPGGEEIAWPAPVFAGDELRATMEVRGGPPLAQPARAGPGHSCAPAAPRRRGGLPQHLHRDVRRHA